MTRLVLVGLSRALHVEALVAARQAAECAAGAHDLRSAAGRSYGDRVGVLLVGSRLVGGEHLLHQLLLLLLLRVVERLLVQTAQLVDDLVAVALVDEKRLTLGRVVHLHGVVGHERVEEGVELVAVVVLLGAQDTAETLGLLAPRAAVTRDLNEHVGVRQVERRVGHLRHEDGVHLWIVLKVLQDLEAFVLRRRSVDVGTVEADGVVLQSEHVVREDDDLVVAALVHADEVLTDAELVRVHDVEERLLARPRAQVLAVELGRHRTPHLAALHLGQEAAILQLEPVRLVQLRSDQKVQVGDLVVYMNRMIRMITNQT